MGRGDDRIVRVVGHGGVGAFALDGEIELIGGSEKRTGSSGELSDFEERPAVEGVHARDVWPEQLVGEYAFFDHSFPASPAFFCGLKDKFDASREACFSCDAFQDSCGSNEDGGVAVVSAGVHFAVVG